ncbi:hypothetical protein D3C81_2029200 [compost metagenome]
MSAFTAREIIVAISARVIVAFGSKVVEVRPVMMPFSAATATYGAYHAVELTSLKLSVAVLFSRFSARISILANSARVTLLLGANLPEPIPSIAPLAATT